MKQTLSVSDRILLRKRAFAETVSDLLKNYFQVGHSRHRPAAGFMNNVTLPDKKLRNRASEVIF